MSETERCIEEIKRAGLFNKEDMYEGMIGEALKELLLVFQKQGHSGYSANLTSSLFKKLINGEPLSPLTDDPSEWNEVGNGVFQSRRCSYVFKDKEYGEDPYTIEGKAFSDDGGKTYFTRYESRVSFKLPGYPPKTEYVIVEAADE